MKGYRNRKPKSLELHRAFGRNVRLMNQVLHAGDHTAALELPVDIQKELRKLDAQLSHCKSLLEALAYKDNPGYSGRMIYYSPLTTEELQTVATKVMR